MDTKKFKDISFKVRNTLILYEVVLVNQYNNITLIAQVKSHIEQNSNI